MPSQPHHLHRRSRWHRSSLRRQRPSKPRSRPRCLHHQPPPRPPPPPVVPIRHSRHHRHPRCTRHFKLARMPPHHRRPRHPRCRPTTSRRCSKTRRSHPPRITSSRWIPSRSIPSNLMVPPLLFNPCQYSNERYHHHHHYHHLLPSFTHSHDPCLVNRLASRIVTCERRSPPRLQLLFKLQTSRSNNANHRSPLPLWS